MKRNIVFLFISSLLLCSFANAQYVDIPDSNFRKFLLIKIPGCFNGAKQMDTSCPGVLNNSGFDVSNKNITSLSGIYYFKKIITFSCNYNSIAKLDSLPNTIISLMANFNASLKLIDKFPDSLQTIALQADSLIYIPSIPSGVVSIDVRSNYLTALPTLPQNLQNLVVSVNKLLTLPTLPGKLRNLVVSQNDLTYLPPLPDSLRLLNFSDNSIATIPNLPDSIQHIYTATNPLYCIPHLPRNLKTLVFDANIKCLPNKPPNCFLSFPNIPTCNVTNNSYQCVSYPQIYGFVYNDNNSNGIYDSGDVPRENIKVKLNNGDYAFTNSYGHFNITADTIGSYRTDIDTPLFYTPVPYSNIHFFTSYTDMVYDTFALQPTMVKDSLSLHIVPLQPIASPGFQLAYFVQCENVGTTILNTAVQMKFDTSRLVYDSASVAGVVLNGDSLFLSPGNVSQGQMLAFKSYFHLKQTAIIGDSLTAYASAKSNAIVENDSTIIPISGNYEPNSKQATPLITPTQVAAGGFIEYIIHFQNTGTDTVFTIVITDTLSPKLRTNFLQMLYSSHPCNTILGYNYITFEFKRINLPDSATNYAKSIGLVHFRIRPDSTLSLGDSISNKASIYFDYNTPIVTNTCQTHITAFILPVKLLNFDAWVKENRRVLNEWATSNEMNLSHFNIQRGMNGRDFKTIGRVNAKDHGSNVEHYSFTDELNDTVKSGRFYYRLEMMDKDGKRTYSAVVVINFSTIGKYAFYPNPAHNSVTVQGNAMRSISILNNAGRTVISKLLMNEKTVELPVSHLPRGLYMLQIRTASGNTTSEKLLVE